MVSPFQQQTLERLLLKSEIEDFLYHEAELLDNREFNAWLDLIAEDIRYFMPMRRNVKFGEQERENTSDQSDISWFDEGKVTLAGRVRQINTGLHWAEEPLSRVCHIISNVQVGELMPAGSHQRDGEAMDKADAAELKRGDEVRVQSRFFVYRNRLQDETDLFVGRRDDILRRDPETGWKIAKRTILLEQNVLLAKNVTIFF